ncbi:hypothetical protein Tco_0344863 [Tanacetum coccineum]
MDTKVDSDESHLVLNRGSTLFRGHVMIFVSDEKNVGSLVPNHRDEDKDAAHSDDPFGLYDLLKNKKGTTNHVPSPSLSHPPPPVLPPVRMLSKVGGQVLDVMEDIIRVGQVMGYSMEGCVKDLENIIGKQGEDNVIR